jgi:PQQ-dependent catabolism-associated CXXCW motif protein
MVRLSVVSALALVPFLTLPAFAQPVVPPWTNVAHNATTAGAVDAPDGKNPPPNSTPAPPSPVSVAPPPPMGPVAPTGPMAAPAPAPVAGATNGSPGFGNPAAPAAPAAQPARQNWADELTDFGVPPQAVLQQNVGSPTPMTIPGGHVITTAEVKQAIGSNILFFDVWNSGGQHPSIPGAALIPGAGAPGSFNDALQQQLWQFLAQAAHQQQQQPMVFFCTGSSCWESYNAALRAINMGFQTVLWYRGGLAAWQASGGQLVDPSQQGQTAPAQPAPPPRIGFGQ